MKHLLSLILGKWPTKFYFPSTASTSKNKKQKTTESTLLYTWFWIMNNTKRSFHSFSGWGQEVYNRSIINLHRTNQCKTIYWRSKWQGEQAMKSNLSYLHKDTQLWQAFWSKNSPLLAWTCQFVDFHPTFAAAPDQTGQGLVHCCRKLEQKGFHVHSISCSILLKVWAQRFSYTLYILFNAVES